MAKNKGPNRTTKNVFKVAGSRTLRIKSKAQKVSINLKKVSQDNFLIFQSFRKKKYLNFVIKKCNGFLVIFFIFFFFSWTN